MMRHLFPQLLLASALSGLLSGQQSNSSADGIFATSLHATSRGVAHWYSKEQGGLESLTGLPITRFNCVSCHADSCDTCHLKEEGGVRVYSRRQALQTATCAKCHGFADVAATRKKGGVIDVHFEKGMACMDCHTAREVHGDGRIYNSLRQEGAMDVSCGGCHEKLSGIASHTVHGGKLDCGACHLKTVPSCHNCHVETRLTGKSLSLPMNNAVFLVNERGKVKAATCLTFVYQNKTMVEFIPNYTHTIVKEGRACKDCHGTSVAADIQSGKFAPGRLVNGGFESVSGVVPVVDGMKWNFVFFDYKEGRWTPNPNAAAPVVHYSGYSSALTAEQFKRLQVVH
jgi:hypothetical protein